MNINKTRVGIFAIILAFLILFSISASSAYTIGNNGFEVTNHEADSFTQLSANKGIQTIEKNKVPKKWKSYKDYAFQVAKGNKIKYKASINSGGDILVTNLKGMKVKGATIDFGDGTKKKTTGWISHTYKKTGWYFITVNLNGSCTGYTLNFGNPQDVKANGKIINGTKIYLVKVTDAPQLSLSKSQPITAGYYSQKSYKKGNIDYLVIKVANLGSKTSKATKVSMWYQKSGDKNIGKIHPKLKKYTASAKLKALKPGKSTKIILRFKIPKKYSKLVKNLRLGTSSLKQISKRDALYTLR
ncbi:hypothetical protein MBBAR_6c01150 [Methanobrevibacter arboriphilus JCM 13429 = DSM 1125]|uniref:PKD domain-containing protein n=1 Tax=Methanobrevibacter arboriphilus JCM 13429 = DSM 1125 TaxID=1300164 RepID=A0A1V6N2V9_METAZ|nr:hypothetical protein [Methanobrevibacter arboriphilus]OQD59005.1 hypothetical protein MBBAR_6c01150 [Methanobrevibacter arboriphilus JCM 13429 = DSM 1125]